MARRPKSYSQITSEVEAAEAKLKTLKELQAAARKQEQSKLAEKIGKAVLKHYGSVDFIGMTDDEIISAIKGSTIPAAKPVQQPVEAPSNSYNPASQPTTAPTSQEV